MPPEFGRQTAPAERYLHCGKDGSDFIMSHLRDRQFCRDRHHKADGEKQSEIRHGTANGETGRNIMNE